MQAQFIWELCVHHAVMVSVCLYYLYIEAHTGQAAKHQSQPAIIDTSSILLS